MYAGAASHGAMCAGATSHGAMYQDVSADVFDFGRGQAIRHCLIATINSYCIDHELSEDWLNNIVHSARVNASNGQLQPLHFNFDLLVELRNLLLKLKAHNHKHEGVKDFATFAASLLAPTDNFKLLACFREARLIMHMNRDRVLFFALTDEHFVSSDGDDLIALGGAKIKLSHLQIMKVRAA